MKYLLDTNVISELRKGRRAAPSVVGWASDVDAKDLATSVLVLAEIRRGIELKRKRDAAQAEALDKWFVGVRRNLDNRVLLIDEPTAERWARLNAPDPLPFIDGLLAATAIERGLTLVTRNTSDIASTGVRVLNPFEV